MLIALEQGRLSDFKGMSSDQIQIDPNGKYCLFFLFIHLFLSVHLFLSLCLFFSVLLFRFVFLFLSACELMSKCLHSCYLFLLFLLFRASARSFKQRSLRVRGRKGLIFPLFLIGLVTSLTVLTFNKRQDCTHSYSTDLT